jgi:hypothetical protein
MAPKSRARQRNLFVVSLWPACKNERDGTHLDEYESRARDFDDGAGLLTRFTRCFSPSRCSWSSSRVPICCGSTARPVMEGSRDRRLQLQIMVRAGSQACRRVLTPKGTRGATAATATLLLAVGTRRRRRAAAEEILTLQWAGQNTRRLHLER